MCGQRGSGLDARCARRSLGSIRRFSDTADSAQYWAAVAESAGTDCLWWSDWANRAECTIGARSEDCEMFIEHSQLLK